MNEASPRPYSSRRSPTPSTVLCPVCNIDQVIVEWGEIELDLCVDGHGVWFDADELRQLFAAAGASGEALSLERRLVELSVKGGGPRRRCPRCSARMTHVAAPGRGKKGEEQLVLDRCPRGHGLWFDEGELEQLAEAEFSGGDPALERVRDHLIGFVHPDRSDGGHANTKEIEG